MPSKGTSSDIAKNLEDIIASFNKKDYSNFSAYTKGAKIVFEKVRAGELSREEADRILEKFEKDVKVSAKLAFHGTSAIFG